MACTCKAGDLETRSQGGCTASGWGCLESPNSYTPGCAPQGVESVKKEIDESVLGQTGPYRRPERLRKRKECAGEKFKEEKVFEANE